MKKFPAIYTVVLSTICVVTISTVGYVVYKEDQLKNAEFKQYWKEVADPILEEKKVQCAKKGSYEGLCQAEAIHEHFELLSKKLNQLWPK
jgi:hypothetical protein